MISISMHSHLGRTWKPAVNPTGIGGRDLATRFGPYMP